MGSGQSPSRFDELDALRGIAAIMVLLFHCFANRSPSPDMLRAATSEDVANLILTTIFSGTGAVTLFFVLSGFVLAESLRGPIGWSTYAGFLVKRVFRLMPVVWLSVGLAIALMAFFHHMAVPWEKVPRALLLDLDATGSFNGPLWSINVEAVASMIFPLLVLAGRSGGLAGRIALLLLFVPAGRYIDVRAVFFLFCFQLGIMVRDFVPLVRRLPPRVTHALLGVSVLAIIIPSNVTRLGFLSAAMSMRIEALGALYLICCLVSGAAPGVTAWLRRAPLVFLGRISFSVYALHYPILGSLAFIAWSVFSPDQYLKAQGMLAIIALPTVLLAAYLSFRLIESPLQSLGRRLAARVTQARPPLLGGALATGTPTSSASAT